MFSGAQSVAVEPHGTCFYRGRSISHLRLIEIAWALWMARCNDVSNNERQSPSVLISIVAQFAQLSRNLIPTWRCVCVLASLITGTWCGSGTNDVPDRFPTSGLFLVKEWQGYLPYLSTRFPAFRGVAQKCLAAGRMSTCHNYQKLPTTTSHKKGSWIWDTDRERQMAQLRKKCKRSTYEQRPNLPTHFWREDPFNECHKEETTTWKEKDGVKYQQTIGRLVFTLHHGVWPLFSAL